MLAGAAFGGAGGNTKRFLPTQDSDESVSFSEAPQSSQSRRRSSGSTLADASRGGTPPASASLARVSSFKAAAVLDSIGLDWSMHSPSTRRDAAKSKFFDRAVILAATTQRPHNAHARREALIPVIHPDRLFYRVWTNILLVLLVWTATVTPFQVRCAALRDS